MTRRGRKAFRLRAKTAVIKCADGNSYIIPAEMVGDHEPNCYPVQVETRKASELSGAKGSP